MKNIVCVSWHSTYPLNTGANVRINKLLTGLKSFSHVLLAPEPEDRHLNHIVFHPFEMPEFLDRLAPINLKILGCYGSKVKRQAFRFLKDTRVDAILCEHLWSFPLARKLADRFSVPLLLDEQLIETLYAERSFGNAAIIKFTSMYEKYALNRSDVVLTVSLFDKKYIADRFSIAEEKIWVVPNGVSLPKNSEDGFQDDLLEKLKDYKVVAFLGKTNVLPNKMAIENIENEILPRLRKKREDIIFLIIGGPGKKDLSKFKKGIVFAGFVPSTNPYLRTADVCVAPLSGNSGTPLKVLEYASFSKPIVATSIATQGLDFDNGRELFVHDDWDEFANAILKLINQTDISAKVGRAAQQKVKSKYLWESIARDFELNLEKLLS